MRESATRPEHHLSDPGKEARARSGIPVVPAFDGYRAFAILGVVAIHLTQISGLAGDGSTTESRVIWGTLGRAVEILFIVSGFVVFLPTVALKGRFGSVRGFMIRRAARLLPAYWLALLFCLALLVSFDLSNPAVPGVQLPTPDLRDILLNFSVLSVPARMFTADSPIGFGLDTPMWTLSSEVIFYLLLPLVAVAFFKRPWWGLAVAAIVTLAWTVAFDHMGSVTEFLGADLAGTEAIRLHLAAAQQFPAWAFSFGLGMAGAWVWVRLHDAGITGAVRRRAGWLSLMALGATAVCALRLGGDGAFTHESLVWSMAFSASISIAMVALALCPESIQKPFATPRIRALGDISYGVYLSHFPIIAVIVASIDFGGMTALGRFAVMTAITLPLAVLYGYLSARFLEQPVRRRARKFGRRTPLAPPDIR